MNQGGAYSLTLVSLLRYTISAFPWLQFTSIVRGIMAVEDEEVRSMGGSSSNHLTLHAL